MKQMLQRCYKARLCITLTIVTVSGRAISLSFHTHRFKTLLRVTYIFTSFSLAYQASSVQLYYGTMTHVFFPIFFSFFLFFVRGHQNNFSNEFQLKCLCGAFLSVFRFSLRPNRTLMRLHTLSLLTGNRNKLHFNTADILMKKLKVILLFISFLYLFIKNMYHENYNNVKL